MPRGTKEVAERGRATRFAGERAVEAAKKGAAARIANIPIRKCLKNIATQALYGHPPLTDDQLKPIAEFFGIKVADVTFAELAIYKQAVEMAKGDQSALNLVAAYAGEKPADKVEVSSPDMTALDEAFEEASKASEDA